MRTKEEVGHSAADFNKALLEIIFPVYVCCGHFLYVTRTAKQILLCQEAAYSQFTFYTRHTDCQKKMCSVFTICKFSLVVLTGEGGCLSLQAAQAVLRSSPMPGFDLCNCPKATEQ